MSKGRLEAFSDGVIAIIITIMVLELRPPEETTPEALWGLRFVFLSYVLSFANIGIYWNNHHHLLQAAKVVDGRVLWSNLLLLFWLSLFPFTTAWMGEHDFAPVPTASYGVVALLAALAYTHLVRSLVRVPGQPAAVAVASGADAKGIASLASYGLGIPVALLGFPLVALAMYIAVAILWFVPDRRLERAIGR